MEYNNLIDLGMIQTLHPRPKGREVSLLDTVIWEGEMNLWIHIRKMGKEVPDEELLDASEGLVRKWSSSVLHKEVNSVIVSLRGLSVGQYQIPTNQMKPYL